MKEENPDMVIDLLPRYCDGTVTDDERKIVEEWMMQSDENYKIAKQIHAIYLAVDTVHALKKVNTEKALKKVKGKMIVKRKTTCWEWVQRSAAILFIPILLAFLIEYLDNSTLPVQMIHVRTNPGMITSVVLPDSTVVYLNSESSLSYPSLFTANTRNVILEGEAYFEVSKDEKKQFIISTPFDAEIAVYGTCFNVEAYPSGKEINATLINGSIGFIYSDGSEKKRIKMKPGQKLTYDTRNQIATLKTTNVDCDIAWKDDKLIFRNTPFPEVLKVLSKRYNVEFIVKRPELENYAFTGSFEHQRLNRIMEYFKISSGIKFRYINDGNINNEREKIEIY